MNTPPHDLEEADLLAALRHAWGLNVTSATYVPQGFGSHHWDVRTAAGGRQFVTVDDLGNKPWLGGDHEVAFAGLRAALNTARDLREERGLTFVVAPVSARDGEVLRRVTDRYTVSVFPWIDGLAGRWGDPLTVDQRKAVLALLADLHQATPDQPTVPICGLSLPDRDALETGLDELHRFWTGGPFSEAARARFVPKELEIRALLADYDRLNGEVSTDEPVLTHGEPHPGNLIWTAEGPALIDWDTVGLAPRERDVWMFDGERDALAHYAERTGASVSASGLSFYRLRWELMDLASFVVTFRSTHERNMDTEKAWNGLVEYLDTYGALGRVRPWSVSGEAETSR